jgi:hypothetical protein
LQASIPLDSLEPQNIEQGMLNVEGKNVLRFDIQNTKPVRLPDIIPATASQFAFQNQ